MHVDLTTLALQAVNFLVLVFLLGKFLYKPVLAAIERRESALTLRREQADAALKSSAEERAHLEAERTQMQRETERLRAEARASVDKERASLLADARKAADQLREAGRLRLHQEREDAQQELEAQAAKLATAMASRLLSEASPEVATRMFIDRLCRDLEALDSAGRTRLLNGTGDVQVITATALAEADAAALSRRLKAALGDELLIRWTIDPSLIAGVELLFRHHIIQHSWRESLTAARDKVTHGNHTLPVA